MSQTEFIDAGGRKIALLRRPGTAPGLIWLGGLRSEMTATKASHLDAFAARRGIAFTRFDYGGHGQSQGRFEDMVLSDWLGDALTVIRKCTDGPQILIGSSMGGWIALRALEELRKAGAEPRIAGLILIAPAPDFTERLMWAEFPPDIRREIMDNGQWLRPSPYSPDAYPITRALIEDGRKHLLLDRGLDLDCPVHVLHGTADPDVPYQLSIELMGRLRGASVALTLVKDGDHRLSTRDNLACLEDILARLRDELSSAVTDKVTR